MSRSNDPKPIPCQELVELVTSYMEGVLPDDARASVDAHLGCCGWCGAYVAQMEETLRVVEHLRPDDLDPRVEARFLAVFREWKSNGGG